MRPPKLTLQAPEQVSEYIGKSDHQPDHNQQLISLIRSETKKSSILQQIMDNVSRLRENVTKISDYLMIEQLSGIVQSELKHCEASLNQVISVASKQKSDRRRKVELYLEKRKLKLTSQPRQYYRKHSAAKKRKRILGQFISNDETQKLERALTQGAFNELNNLNVQAIGCRPGQLMVKNQQGYEHYQKDKIIQAVDGVLKQNKMMMMRLKLRKPIFQLF